MLRFPSRQISPLKCHRDWLAWENSDLAQDITCCERALLNPFLARKFGSHLVQISISNRVALYSQSPIANKTLMHFDLPGISGGSSCVSRPDYLPFANDSVDAIILHHVLEFSDNPHQILREAERALTSGGQLFIISFNPWSPFGLRKKLTLHRQAPWAGHYFSRFRLTDWLSLLNFSHEETRYGHFKLPISHQRLLSKSQKIETMGQKYNCFLGAFYVMVARKQVAGMMPLQEKPRQRPRIIAFPLSEPTARQLNRKPPTEIL